MSSPQASADRSEQPERLRDLRNMLAAERRDDCLPCRIIGASAFIGLGAYSYLSGRHQLRVREAEILKSGSRFGMRSRRFGISALGTALVGVGLWRAIN